MGLGKMLGLGSKGKINVNTEKPTYYPGEVNNIFDIKIPIKLLYDLKTNIFWNALLNDIRYINIDNIMLYKFIAGNTI